MRRLISPTALALMVMLAGLVQAALVTGLALNQPWLGLHLTPDDEGRIVVDRVSERGAMSEDAVGTRLLALAGSEGADIPLLPADLTAEPDMLPSPSETARFFDTQGALHAALRDGPVTLRLQTAQGQQAVTVMPQASRPLADLPLEFWVQVVVGLAGIWLGGWVLAIRVTDKAAWMFLVAGLGLAISAHSAAIYSTRELALASGLFRAASLANTTGTLLFGVGMITLFLIYPARLVRGAVLTLPTVLLAAATLWTQALNWPQNLPDLQWVIALAVLALLATILVQVYVNRRDPKARVMLGWFGLSVATGAGGFALAVIVPTLLGLPPLMSQGFAFAFFLVIYIGLALGIARYRLFDMSDWAFRVLVYCGAVFLTLLMAAVLAFFTPLAGSSALTLGFILVLLVFLLSRRFLQRLWSAGLPLSPDVLFGRVTGIALAPDATAQTARMRDLLDEVFAPLDIQTALDPGATTRLVDEGAAMQVAPVEGIPGFRLMWARRGQGLFSSRDLAAAISLMDVVQQSIHQHRNWSEAVDQERSRINRDMHDNIGVLLLGALHSPSTDRKDLLIRQTLTDLREIISNPYQGPMPLQGLLADLRAEMSEYMMAAGVSLDWNDRDVTEAMLPPRIVHTLRAFLREGASNLLRHAKAGAARVEVSRRGDWLHLALADDGLGFEVGKVALGNGTGNIASRISQVGGQFRLTSTPGQGTRLEADLPLGEAAA